MTPTEYKSIPDIGLVLYMNDLVMYEKQNCIIKLYRPQEDFEISIVHFIKLCELTDLKMLPNGFYKFDGVVSKIDFSWRKMEMCILKNKDFIFPEINENTLRKIGTVDVLQNVNDLINFDVSQMPMG